MRRGKKIAWTLGGLLMVGGISPLSASFGDAVVGGVVGGVVGSVITNEVYRSGRHSSTRHRSTRKRHRTAPRPVMTDEKRIQMALRSLGFYRGAIDGQINSFETRTAIKELNRAYEIGDTAYLSPQERDALIYLGTLLQFDRNLIAQGSDRRTRTKRSQTALKVLGFYTGKLDGSSGPMTRRAISEYRAANGLSPSYHLGYEDEYRLVTTAKQANDRNIEDTLASLKRLGAANRGSGLKMQPAPAQNRQPVILQPAQPQAPVQGTIVQEAPAPVAPQPRQAAPAPTYSQPSATAPNPAAPPQTATSQQGSLPTQEIPQPQPVQLQPAQ